MTGSFRPSTQVLCYTEPVEDGMRNLTLAIEEDVLLAARKYALEHGTTVNQLVRAYLEEVAAGDARHRQAAERMRRNLDRLELEVGPRSWTREDLYDR